MMSIVSVGSRGIKEIMKTVLIVLACIILAWLIRREEKRFNSLLKKLFLL